MIILRIDEKPNDLLQGYNPIREKLKERNSVDFTTSTLRRLALLHQSHDQ